MKHAHGSCCAVPLDNKQYQYLVLKTIIASILGTVLFVISMFDLVPPLHTESGYYINCCAALLSLGVLLYCGADFFVGAWRAFKAHYATMDTLIALGTGSAWIYSVLVLLLINTLPTQMNVYFESTVVIIALVNLGMLIEMRARRKTSSAITQLLNLQPKTACVIRKDQEINVNIAQLQINDLIRVRAGEQIPVDGIIVSGDSDVDESMLTGEAMPLHKKIDDFVTGGTLNKSGSFIFKATTIGTATVLAQIVNLVQQAQNSKPPLAKLADKIAAIFVPLVLIIAIATALIWYDFGPEPTPVYMLITAMSVLVIACPCAVGLAVPISVMIGVGKAAQFGILVRNADALQKMCKVTTVVLDKTGTITLGEPRIINIFPMPNQDIRSILTVAASLEMGSEHPYATAIRQAAHGQELQCAKVDNFHAVAGLGINGLIDGVPVAVGNASFMEAQLINVEGMQEQAKQSAEYGQTLIYVAKNKVLIGGLSIADPIKPEAKSVVAQLKALQLKVIMITGDQHTTAAAVAKRVGIDEVIAEVMPQEKASKIDALQMQDEVVCMVGDGINDALALTQADVGIALATGSDIAIESADITLIAHSLQSVVDTIYISRKTVENMRQNLKGAFIYNIIGIPIAAGILYPLIGVLLNPMLAGLAMALSSFTVVTNANRLRLIKPTTTGDK